MSDNMLMLNEQNTNISTIVIPNNVHFVRWFLNLKANKSIGTSEGYERDIRQFFNVESIEDITINDIISVNILDAEQWIMTMSKDGLSSATIHRKLSALSALYKWLLKFSENKTGKQVIKFNPFSNLTEEKPTLNNKQTEFLTQEEAHKLLESIDITTILGYRNKTILALLITTAIRKSEAINIKLKDITDVNGYDVIKVTRKGGKEDLVKLQPPVRHMIEEYIKQTGRNKEDNKDDYLFIGHSTNHLNNAEEGKQLDRSTLNYMIKKACKKANINKDITVHGLRHTGITLAITAGASIEKVRDFAGHKNLATTNRYVHSIDKLKNNAGDLISVL